MVVDALRLFGEIQQRGYSGSYDTVARYTRRFRQAQGTQQRKRRRSSNYKQVSPRNCLLHRVVLHIWYYDDRKNGNQTMNNSYKSWQSILTSPKRLNLPFSLPSLFMA